MKGATAVSSATVLVMRLQVQLNLVLVRIQHSIRIVSHLIRMFVSKHVADFPRITTPVLSYSQEIVGETSFVITGNEAQEHCWKGFGFKLHVPQNTLKSGISDCTIHVKAFLPNCYLKLPENTQLVSAIYCISMPSASTLRETVDIEIEHCCKLVEGNREMLRFVTSKSAYWETASFTYIDGGHFPGESRFGRISLHHFSWFATVWRGIMSLFSVRYCIKVYQESAFLTTKYIYFVLIKDLEVNIEVIKQYM